jgi:integrase
MSEASINMVIKRIGYDGKVTGHGFRHTMSTILHEQGLIQSGSRCSSLTWIKTAFAAHITMHSIWMEDEK